MKGQTVIRTKGEYGALDCFLKENGVKKILLVCGGSIQRLKIYECFQKMEHRLGIRVEQFSDFQPNPSYESVIRGVEKLRLHGCDSVFAVGGGSAIDVAKCIKLYANMDGDGREPDIFLYRQAAPNKVQLYAMPTTAGTGSEATRYAVVYYKDMKQSVDNAGCIPSMVLLDASVLKTLPVYQKRATALDALCHAIESFWSVNSTRESKEYSKEAIRLILENIDPYICNKDSGNEGMLLAANYAGKAINIAQTTAGHAMCYKLTSLYGIAHGHAAALCVRKLWPYMIENVDKCIDGRGQAYLERVFLELAVAFGCKVPMEAAVEFHTIFDKLGMEIPECPEEDIEILRISVNYARLKNNPVGLTEDAIETLYRQMLDRGQR